MSTRSTASTKPGGYAKQIEKFNNHHIFNEITVTSEHQFLLRMWVWSDTTDVVSACAVHARRGS
ncbi:hypothetical protein EHN07_00275 [Buttiauxella warmboldiae]|uniref:Uncharacterized protein n=1 Tax=Buttiauxella warmboldiae TaxID=82993 RepID=A0A3N5DZW6_9ENTR|nr:hypothetical protein EHN07_00275 [Buttiauxella warmboldiae]